MGFHGAGFWSSGKEDGHRIIELSATVGRNQWDVLCGLRASKTSTLSSWGSSVRSVLRF